MREDISVRRSKVVELFSQISRRDQKKPLDVMRVRPQPKQEELLEACGLLDWYWDRGGITQCVASVIGYGGAAYGAKTFGVLILAAVAALAFPGVQIVFFRRTYSQIFGPGGAINDARVVFSGMGEWRDEGKEFNFSNGSCFYFRHCENESDVYKYDGQQFDILIIDEATHMSFKMVDYLMGRNRISGPNGLPRPFCVMPSNPGNIGHAWYYNLFDLGEKVVGLGGSTEHQQVKTVTNENGRRIRTYFIQSRIEDNPIGLSRDPEYPERLMTQDPSRARALLGGDWESFSGQAFMEFDMRRHVIPMRAFPENWATIVGVDGGYYDPFCTLWGKVEPRTGRVYIFRELYQAGLTDDVQAEQIRMATIKEDNVMAYYGDPDYFWKSKNVRGEVRTAYDEYLDKGIFLTRGDGDRVNGVRKVHRFLADGPDGKPLLIICENCYNLINEIPKLSVDPNNREDVNPKTEADHAFSALKYLLSNVEVYRQRDDDEMPEDRRVNPGKGQSPLARVKGL